MVRAIGEEAWAALDRCADPIDKPMLEALSPIVVIAPHPDDETLGCGGLLATAANAGLQPQVVYLTDGSASHQGSALWPKSRLAEVRRIEARTALSVLGVAGSQIFFMDWADSEPLQPFSDAYEESVARLTAWLTLIAPRSLWAPRAGESHCDHQAATNLAADVARTRVPSLRLFDYLVWGWKDPEVAQRRAGERCWRLDCDGLTDQRRRALASHQTQTTPLIADAVDAFLIPPELAALAGRPSEIFFEHP